MNILAWIQNIACSVTQLVMALLAALATQMGVINTGVMDSIAFIVDLQVLALLVVQVIPTNVMKDKSEWKI